MLKPDTLKVGIYRRISLDKRCEESGVERLRDEANGLRDKLDKITMDYVDGILSARQLKVATDVTEDKLARVESQLAKVGSKNVISSLITVADPAAAWMKMDDVNAQVTIIDALGTIYVSRQPKGARRPSPKNKEKHDEWLEGLINSVRIEWHKAPHLEVV